MKNDEAEIYFDAASALLGLPVRPEYREEALAAFKVLTEQAALVMAFALPEETDAAPRFTP
jgi:hypothetical protein